MLNFVTHCVLSPKKKCKHLPKPAHIWVRRLWQPEGVPCSLDGTTPSCFPNHHLQNYSWIPREDDIYKLSLTTTGNVRRWISFHEEERIPGCAYYSCVASLREVMVSLTVPVLSAGCHWGMNLSQLDTIAVIQAESPRTNKCCKNFLSTDGTLEMFHSAVTYQTESSAELTVLC